MSEKEPSVSDDEWAAIVEAARADGVGAGVPKVRRWRFRRGGAGAPRRAAPARTPAQPEGWRTGPAWQEMNGRGKARRQVKGVIGMVLVVALGLVAFRPELLTDRLPDGWLPGTETTPLAAETAPPSAAPAAETFPDTPTLKEPFKGSPALRWADGAAGIEPPPAKAVGWMSKKQTAAALKRAKDFLVAANLDPAVIKGGKPTAALALLDPEQGGLRSEVDTWLAHPTEKGDPTRVFSRFDPSEVRLVGRVVKLRGRMTVEEGKGKDAGTVLVRTDYTFVYPLVKTRPGADEVARTIVRREITFSFAEPGRFRVTPGKLGISYWHSSIGNSTCDHAPDGFLHPTFPEDLRAQPAPAPSGPATDPYDRSKSLDDLPGECGTTTRT
ncbi:hypothetical protein [Streptomyces sp. NPDC008121]|uniref:hypothetical protein n=1 Tax=Streptomyces sp. NPDC008121 TaxID=3364809 RepID=UPI0036E41614